MSEYQTSKIRAMPNSEWNKVSILDRFLKYVLNQTRSRSVYSYRNAFVFGFGLLLYKKLNAQKFSFQTFTVNGNR